jgi:hypothetical protein
MALSNFTRPDSPYENKPLPNDSKFRIRTRVEKSPITDQMFEDDANAALDRDNQLDMKIENLVAGIIPGIQDPNNAFTLVGSDGNGNQVLTKVSPNYILDQSMPATKLVPLSVGPAQIANGGVTPPKIPDNSIPYSKMNFQGQDIPYAIINVPDGAILYSKLNIPDTTIPYPKLNIPDNTIPGPKLTNKSITQQQQGLLSVGTPELIDEAITLPKMAPNVLTPAATKADQIAANSNAVYTSPAVQQFHPSANKFSCNFNGTLLGTNPPRSGYNVVSVERLSAGLYKINFIVPFSNTDYVINGSSNYISGNPLPNFGINTLSTGFCQIVLGINGTFLDASVVCVEGSGLQ